MKKRHIVFLVAALVPFVTLILPPLITRISYESKHTGYVTAIDLNDTATYYDRGGLYSALLAYKASGVTTAVLREDEGGGFNSSLLELSSLAGLDTALAVYGGDEKSLTYEKNLRNVFSRYPVKYLILMSAPTSQQGQIRTANTFDFAKYIDEYQLVLVLRENLTQVSNETPPCFESCLSAAKGRVLRCYETLPAPGGGEDRVFHQMMNSARDRNTEFLLIRQRTDMADTPEGNAVATQNAIKRFCAWMQRAGYTPGPAGTLDGYTTNLHLVPGTAIVLMALMLIFMLYVLLGKSFVWLDWLIVVASVFASLLPNTFPKTAWIYPMLFATISACFCYTLAVYSLQRLKDRLSAVACCCSVVGISFVSLLACCSVLAAMLSGADYYLNILVFRGVSYTLVFPVLYAVVLSFAPSVQKSFASGTIKEDALRIAKRFRWYHPPIVIAGLFVLYFYLLRSGNSSISYFETQVRNLLGEWSLARPRTKEFLLGWPLLVLFVLSEKHKMPRLLRWLFGIGSAVLFASVMNTFCHVFTDATTSALRTVNGLLFAIPLILIVFAASRIFLSLTAKRKLDKQENL